jgi:uncharacterized protein (DUF1778 family)
MLTYGRLPHKLDGCRLNLGFPAMASTTDPKTTSRLEARINPETKALIQKAADLEGRTLTDFVVTSVQTAASRVIEQHQSLKLSIEDSEAFVEAILNPPKPNDALNAAASRYKKMSL